jgi:hypothetical protein
MIDLQPISQRSNALTMKPCRLFSRLAVLQLSSMATLIDIDQCK